MQLNGGRDALLAAALALPGLGLEGVAEAAGTPPPTAVLEVYAAHYQDRQPGARRMQVNSPALLWIAPLSERWTLRTGLLTDAVSGASPLFHDTLSGASGVGIEDLRRAADLELTRHFGRVDLTVGAAVSDENDYDSGALRVRLAMDSADRNQTWTLGIGGSNDHIDSVNGLAVDRFRLQRELQLGWTRVWDPLTVISLEASLSHSNGYHDDPYKPLDARPGSRRMRTISLRGLRHWPELSGTLRADLRGYADSWSVSAQSLELEWEQSLGTWLSVTPRLRYHTQSAAAFYVDPPFGGGFVLGQPYSADTRLAAFGAVTLGLSLQWTVDEHWQLRFGHEIYRQRSRWRAFGAGSPGVNLVDADLWQVNLRYRW